MSEPFEDPLSVVVAQLYEIARAYAESGDVKRLIEIRDLASLADGPVLTEYAPSMAIWMREEKVRAEEAMRAFELGLVFGTRLMKQAKPHQVLIKNSTVSGSNVAAADVVSQCTNSVAGMDPGDLKVLLAELCRSIDNILAALPVPTREGVVRDLDTFVSESQQKQLRPQWLRLSAKGLVDAAQAVGDVASPIITTVTKVLALLGLPLQ